MRSPVSVCLDTRKMSTTGENKNKFPIKIKVNFKVRNGKKNEYRVRRYHIHPAEVFCKRGEFGKKKNDSAVVLAHAKALSLHNKNLSIDEFERLYTGSGALEDIKTVFEYVIKKLREQERDGTADSYEQALSSFMSFKGEYISFDSITVEWLKSYERWMLKEVRNSDGEITRPARSITTVGIYCRALRTVFNTAIDPLKIINRSVFPFGVRKYVIPKGRRKTKKALNVEEKNIVLFHRSGRDDVNRALDFWAYQFFCDGCNMADVAYLKGKSIDGDFLSFDRKKTENTERDQQPIDVYINDRMWQVIRKHGNRSLDPGAYVFPVLRAGMTSRQRKSTIKDFIKDINALLAVAQDEINKDGVRLTIKLTSGTARYTAATLLKRHGIDLRTIAKALGHGSELTTEHYTDEERETQIKISQLLAL